MRLSSVRSLAFYQLVCLAAINNSFRTWQLKQVADRFNWLRANCNSAPLSLSHSLAVSSYLRNEKRRDKHHVLLKELDICPSVYIILVSYIFVGLEFINWRFLIELDSGSRSFAVFLSSPFLFVSLAPSLSIVFLL